MVRTLRCLEAKESSSDSMGTPSASNMNSCEQQNKR